MDGSLPATDAVKRSLVRKLVEVMAVVDRIPKSGHNDFHNYDYTTEADVLEAVRGELARRCVLIVPCAIDSKETAVGEKGQRVFTQRMRFTAHDGESGETLSWDMYGQGSDSLDKGAFKSTTGAVKYGLLKLFLVPTGDDPERESASSVTPPPPAGVNGLKSRMKPQPPAPPPGASHKAAHDRGLTFGFGSGKGQPIGSLDDKSLVWYAGCLQRDLADAAKAKWHAKTAQQLATIQAEQRMRANLLPEHSHASAPGEYDEPPPPTDNDAPF